MTILIKFLLKTQDYREKEEFVTKVMVLVVFEIFVVLVVKIAAIVIALVFAKTVGSKIRDKSRLQIEEICEISMLKIKAKVNLMTLNDLDCYEKTLNHHNIGK